MTKTTTSTKTATVKTSGKTSAFKPYAKGAELTPFQIGLAEANRLADLYQNTMGKKKADTDARLSALFELARTMDKLDSNLTKELLAIHPDWDYDRFQTWASGKGWWPAADAAKATAVMQAARRANQTSALTFEHKGLTYDLDWARVLARVELALNARRQRAAAKTSTTTSTPTEPGRGTPCGPVVAPEPTSATVDDLTDQLAEARETIGKLQETARQRDNQIDQLKTQLVTLDADVRKLIQDLLAAGNELAGASAVRGKSDLLKPWRNVSGKAKALLKEYK